MILLKLHSNSIVHVYVYVVIDGLSFHEIVIDNIMRYAIYAQYLAEDGTMSWGVLEDEIDKFIKGNIYKKGKEDGKAEAESNSMA